MNEHMRHVRNCVFRPLFKKYSANGVFFTQGEFESNSGKIGWANHCLNKIEGHIPFVATIDAKKK